MGEGGSEPEVELFRGQGGGPRTSVALRRWRERRRVQRGLPLEYALTRHVDRAMRPRPESMP